MPKARTPRMWVTVFASHPSVSIETETTHLTCSPSLPGLPTVFITSRSRSSSVRSSASRPGNRLAILGLELLDLGSRDRLEVRTHCLAGFELGAVDQDRVGAVQPCAVPRRCGRSAVAPPGRTVLSPICRLPAGDEVEHQLGDIRVVADDDEDRRRQPPRLRLGFGLPKPVLLS